MHTVTFHFTHIPVISVETDDAGGNILLCWYSSPDHVGQPGKRKLVLVFDNLQKCHQWMALQYTIIAKIVDNNENKRI